jgi:hypothetical protein
MQQIEGICRYAYHLLVASLRGRLAKGALCIAIGSVCLLPAQSSVAADVSHCTEEPTRAAVLSFIKAFNQGNYESLDTQFAQPPDFEWYSSVRPSRFIGPAKRDHLVDYFRARHQLDDRLGLISFQFNGDSGKYGNFGLKLRRSVDNFRHGAWFRINAKGSLICADGSTQLTVVTLGPPDPAGGAATDRARS